MGTGQSKESEGVTGGDNLEQIHQRKQHRAESEAEKLVQRFWPKGGLNRDWQLQTMIALKLLCWVVEVPGNERWNYAISTNYQLDKFGPTPTEDIVERDLLRKAQAMLVKRVRSSSTSAVLIVGSAIFVTYNWMHSRGKSGGTTVVSSSSNRTSSTSKSSSSETQAQKLEEFTRAYDAFCR